jgi:iron complex outermembrane receptor protein
LKYKGRSGGLNWYAGLFVDDLQTRRFEGGGQVLGGDIQNKDTADKFGSLVMSQAGLRQALGADYEWHLDSYFWRNDYGQSFFLNSAAGFTLDKQHFIEQRKGISIGFRPILVEGGDDTRLAPTQGHDIAIRLGFENAAIVDHMNEKIVLSDGSVNDSFVSYKGLEQDILSLSVENKIALDPQHWKLLWGARLDDYSSFGAQISPRFGLIWLPTRHLATKLLYGEAFRAPNANEIRGTSFVAENTSIEPETLKNLELVFSYLCNSQRIELTAFHSLWEDRILLAAASDTPLGRRYINSGKSESEGLELTLHHQFTDWYFDTTASYIVNTNRDSGQENTVFPKLMLNAGVGFDWPQQGVSVYWSHQLHDDFKVGDQALSAQPLADGPIYYRSDVNISQSFNGGYSIYLGIRNIFDRENTLPSVVNSYDGVSGLSRQLVLGFRYDFADSA